MQNQAMTKEYREVLQTMIDNIPGFGAMAICPVPTLDEIIKNAMAFQVTLVS